MRNWLNNFRYFDVYIATSSTLLLVLGLLMIYSTTLEDASNLMWRQLAFAIAGYVGLFALAFFDYRKLKNASWVVYLGVVLSLISVWLFGETIQGSTRWFDVGFFLIQPSEFAKLGMVIVMAKFLDRNLERIKDFRYVAMFAIYAGIPAVLIFIEPDLGSSIVIFLIWLGMLLASNVNKRHLMILFAAFLVAASLSWFFVLQDYQKDRIHTFFNPESDPLGTGYNVIQSEIAVGSGEITGRGVGRGYQSQLNFLPARQTDFIFAAIAEELGFLGSMFVLGMFGVIFYRLVQATKHARDNFGMYLSLGVLIMFLSQMVINIGMNIKLAPVTGIPLPFVSCGGSSLLTSLFALGLVQSIIARQKALRFSQ